MTLLKLSNAPMYLFTKSIKYEPGLYILLHTYLIAKCA